MVVSIIVPMFNEEKAVSKVIRDLKKIRTKKEIIVIDDGSKDKSYEIVKKIKGVKLLRHKINKGKGEALRTGIRKSKGNIIVTIDADCTYPASYIPKLIDQIKKGNELVIGSRFLGKKIKMPFFNHMGNKIFSSLISILSRKKITDGSSGLRSFKKDILKKINVKSSGLSWEVEMTTKCLVNNIKVKEISIPYYDREGRSNLNVIKDGIMFFAYILDSLTSST